MHLPAWAERTRVTGHVRLVVVGETGHARPAAPTTSRQPHSGTSSRSDPCGDVLLPWGCSAPAGQDLASGAGRDCHKSPQLLQPPRGQSRSCRRSGRVLKRVLLLNTRDVPTAPWRAAYRVPPAHRCAPGTTGLEIPLVSWVGNQTAPGTALGTAKRSGGG